MAELDDFAAYSRLADSLIAQYLTLMEWSAPLL